MIQKDLTGNVAEQFFIKQSEEWSERVKQIERMIVLHNKLMSGLYAQKKVLLNRLQRKDYTFSEKWVKDLIEEINLVKVNTYEIIQILLSDVMKEKNHYANVIRICYEIDDSFGGTYRTYNVPKPHSLKTFKKFQEEKWKKARGAES